VVTEGGAGARDDRQYLLLSKKGHRFIFCYRSGQERQLYLRLIHCVRDPSTPLGWPDVCLVMEQVAARRTQEERPAP
jgi:hypothetical protein